MKRWTFIAVLLFFCTALPVSVEARNKQAGPDLSNAQHVFVGWADMDPEAYIDLGYSKAEWEDVIRHENVVFQKKFKEGLKLRFITVVAAKDKSDENTAGNDLYVKFSDVSFDSGYVLHLAVQIIDLKTNTEIASIPYRRYTGHLCGLTTCMEQEFDEVNTKLQVLLGGHVDKWAGRR
jgi:hypothetical protein